jgi:hypothetical protein
MKTPMIRLLETIQQNVMHKLPHYDDFKKAYKGKTLEKYSAEPITENQKISINELIKTNKLLFGYRNDIKSVGVLTNIIEYSTFCGDPVEMAKRKLGKTGYSMLPGKSKIAQMRDKIIQIMHYFYYHPDITREIGAALEKYVDVPLRHRTNPENMFDYNYNEGDSIFFEKNGIRRVGIILKKDKKQYQVSDYTDKSKIMQVTLRENDILGYGDNKGGIISWIFTNVVINDFTEACLDPTYDGDRESKKCEQGSPLNMRNNVICTLYEGAKTVDPNTQYPEIKICTECKEEDNMSATTDLESRDSSKDLGHRDAVYLDNDRPSSTSSISSDALSNRYSEDSDLEFRDAIIDRPSLSSDTSNTTLTDEESKAYEKFKEAVCKTGLSMKEQDYNRTITDKDQQIASKNDKIKSQEREIQKLKIDLNKEQRRVGPRIFSRPPRQGGGQQDSLMDKLQKGEIKENRADETTRQYPDRTYLEVTYTEEGETDTNEICFRRYIKNLKTEDIYGIVGTSKYGRKAMVKNACNEGYEWYYYFVDTPDWVKRVSEKVIIDAKEIKSGGKRKTKKSKKGSKKKSSTKKMRKHSTHRNKKSTTKSKKSRK